MITYKNCNIFRLHPSGYYQTYVAGHFICADTLAGIKQYITQELSAVGLKRAVL